MESVAEILVSPFEDWGGAYPEVFSLLVLGIGDHCFRTVFLVENVIYENTWTRSDISCALLTT